jgi:hypothetical protein
MTISQAKLLFLSNIVTHRVNASNADGTLQTPVATNANLDSQPTSPNNTELNNPRLRAGFDSLVLLKELPKQVTKVATTQAHDNSGKLAVIVGGVVIAVTGGIGSFVAFSRKKSVEKGVVETGVKVAEKAVDEVATTIVPEVVAAVVDPLLVAQETQLPQSNTTRFVHWVSSKIPFKKTPAPSATNVAPINPLSATPIASLPIGLNPTVSAPIITHPPTPSTVVASTYASQIPVANKCKPKTAGFPAYVLYRDSQKPNAQDLALTISNRAKGFHAKTEPAIAHLNLYEFYTFLNALEQGEIKLPTGKSYHQWGVGDVPEMKTLATNDLHTIPVIMQLLSDAKHLLQAPTYLTATTPERAKLNAKIELFMAAMNTYLQQGTKPAHWDALIAQSDTTDVDMIKTLNNVLQAGKAYKEVGKGNLQILYADFKENLLAVVGREQALYIDLYNQNRPFRQQDGTLVLPRFESH